MKLFFLNLILFSVTTFTVAQSGNNKDSLLRLLANQQNDSVKTTLLLKIGIFYGDQSKLDSALFYFQKALDLNRKIKSSALQLKARDRIAHTYNDMGNYPEALRLSLENLKLEEQIHDTSLIFLTKREI